MTAAARPGLSRRRVRALALFAGLVGAVAVLVAAWDWNWFKGPLERRVSAATGRTFEIGGRFDVDLHWGYATLKGEAVRLGNAQWSKHDTMFEADAAEIDLAYWPLLRGKYRVPGARLHRPVLLLERQANLPPNWKFERRGGKRSIDIGDLQVAEGRVEVADAPTRTDLSIHARSAARGVDDARAPLLVGGSGRYRGFDFDLQGRIESPLELIDQSRPYRVDMRARAGDSRVHAYGTLAGMGRLRNFDVHLEASGDDLARLDALVGLVMPSTPPYSFDGELQRRGDTWRYTRIAGTVGDTDLRGDARLELGGARPRLTADMTSNLLDFDDLAGLVGAAPSTRPGESATQAQRRLAAEQARRFRVLPTHRYRVARLKRMDADVKLHALRVDAGKLPIESLQGRLRLERGVVRIEPLRVGVAGGRVEGTLGLDASKEPITASADLTLLGLELPKLFEKAELTRSSVGRIGGRIALRGTGDSIAALAASADGEATVLMGRGRVSNLLLELAGLDVAEALGFLLGRDKVVPLRCAIADLEVDDGVASTRQFVFDTTDTIIFGEGDIDLREERFDLELKPRPKDHSLVSLRSPLEIDGRFKDPDIHPKPGPLALRGLAAAALYSIAPPATLLALIETGPGKDSDCELDPVATKAPDED